MLRPGAIRDFVLWRDELRHSIGNSIIPESNTAEITKYLCCEQELHCKCDQFAFLVTLAVPCNCTVYY